AIDALDGRLHALELGALPRLLECRFVAAMVHSDAALGADHLREVERKPVRVVELERVCPRELTTALALELREALLEQQEPALDRVPEPDLFAFDDASNELLAFTELGVRVAHELGNAERHLVEKGALDSEAMPVTNRAAHHAPEHVLAPGPIRHHALSSEEHTSELQS